MQSLPFDQPGRFWRGNLHTHSTRSDGALSPEEVCALYRRAGYDFLSITDHFMERYDFPVTDVRSQDSTDFITIPGAELHTGQTELGSVWHILAVGLPFDFARTPDDEAPDALARRAMDAGAYVAVAHPNWYALTERDIESLGPVHAIEIINGIAADHNDGADSWAIADVFLGRGRRYTACATDDYHGHENRDDFQRGWVHVKAESLTADALVDALKRGAYYSSTGPEIYNIQIKAGNVAQIDCSPADRVWVTGVGSMSAYAYGVGKSRFEIDLTKFQSPYCRITVRDRYGRRAWSNPIWL